MEHLDRMEYDPVNPAPYNIKVLQEKRKKIKETWDRVYRLYVSRIRLTVVRSKSQICRVGMYGIKLFGYGPSHLECRLREN